MENSNNLIDASDVLSNKQNSGLKRPIYNPVEDYKEDETTRIWNSESVQLAEDGLNMNRKLKDNPFYTDRNKEFRYRRANLPFEFSDEELEVMALLMSDINLFGNTVIELKDGDKGWQKITLRDYQEQLLLDYETHNRHILMFPRQSGKTTTTIVAIVHFILHNIDKDIVVIAQSDTVVNEIMSKVKSAYSKIPFFMQKGVVKWTNDTAIFDNGCRLRVGVAKESVVQGFSLDFLFIDEFAYIDDKVANKFWINIVPALKNNPKSKCIIASTPNGRNLFYKMWSKAESKSDPHFKFKPSRIYWYEVPRIQSLEEFKAEVIAEIGLEGWLMGYECSFDTQLNSIFSTETQVYLRNSQSLFNKNWSMENDPIGLKYGMRFIDKSIIDYDLMKDYFIFGVDIAEGLGQDSSVIKIRKMCYEDNEFKYKLIGIYQDNNIAVDDFARLFMNLTMEFNENNIQASVENNNYGGEFFNQIENLSLYNSDYYNFDINVIAKFRRAKNESYEFGYRTDARRKNTSVSLYKRLITKRIMDDTDEKSINEALNFGSKNENGTKYCANYGHDDLVASDLAIAFFLNSNDVFNTQFLEDSKLQIKIGLRLLEDEKVREHFEKIEAEKRKSVQILSTPKGTKIRNSKEIINNRKMDAIKRRKLQREDDEEFYGDMMKVNGFGVKTRSINKGRR